MLSLEEARARLAARAVLTGGETVALADAGGRVLVDPNVRAAVDVPAFANSAMDGYAVRAAETPGRLHVTSEVVAGMATVPAVATGTAVRIMTGAPIPPGADAVVPLELADERDGWVTLVAARAGDHVRAAAHDTRKGDAVELRGPLTPARLAVLASLGIGSVEVRRPPVVAILSTGDELAAPGTALGPHQIHDANAVALAQAVRDAGAAPLIVARVRDDASAVEAALVDASRRADVVVTSAGVSVGRHDHVRGVLEARGAVDFWRIRLQPGKPLAVGEVDGTTVIGLPGNPVSALVVFEVIVRPFLRALLGLAGDGRVRVAVRSVERIAKDRDRRAFLRVVVASTEEGLVARPAGGQGSSQLRPLAAANALLVVPEGEDAAEPGRPYEAILLEPLAAVGGGA